MAKISIEGLSKAEVLAALFNAARPQGLGFMQYDSKPMTKDVAQTILDSGQTYFDYLQGRVMKLNLKEDTEFDSRLYDRDNGPDAAMTVITALRAGIERDGIPDMHKSGVLAAAEHIKRNKDAYGIPDEIVDKAVHSTEDDDDGSGLAAGVAVVEGIASLLSSEEGTTSVPDATGFEGFGGGESGGGGASDDFSGGGSDTGTCDASEGENT